MADIAFYRWEYNFRASTVLGLVGCGGIGQEIQTSISLMEYRQLSALLLIVAVCVTAVEALSNTLRRSSR
jgi:phosphonate transport system permease protein